MTDYLAGLFLLLAGVWFFICLSRNMGLAGWPVAAFGLVLTPIGSFIYLPSSQVSITHDGIGYLEWGSAIAERWLGGTIQTYSDPIWPGKGVWPTVIAVANLALGPVEFVPLIISVLALLAAFVAVQKSASMISPDGRLPALVLLVLTSPSIVLFGPSLLRESFFWLGVSLIALSLSQLAFSSVRNSLISLGVGTLICLAFRPDVGIALVYLSIVLLIVIAISKRKLLLWEKLSLILTSSVPLALSFPFAFSQLQPTASVSKIGAINQGLAEEGVDSAFARPLMISETWCDSNLYLKLICEAALNSPRSYFGPFLWESDFSLILVVASLSTAHLWALFVFSFIGIRTTRGASRFVIFCLLVLAFASTVIWASTLTNFGILIRFRGTTEIILLPAAVVGVTKAWCHLRKNADLPRLLKLLRPISV